VPNFATQSVIVLNAVFHDDIIMLNVIKLDIIRLGVIMLIAIVLNWLCRIFMHYAEFLNIFRVVMLRPYF
jgi:hypothetical protein